MAPATLHSCNAACVPGQRRRTLHLSPRQLTGATRLPCPQYDTTGVARIRAPVFVVAGGMQLSALLVLLSSLTAAQRASFAAGPLVNAAARTPPPPPPASAATASANGSSSAAPANATAGGGNGTAMAAAPAAGAGLTAAAADAILQAAGTLGFANITDALSSNVLGLPPLLLLTQSASLPNASAIGTTLAASLGATSTGTGNRTSFTFDMQRDVIVSGPLASGAATPGEVAAGRCAEWASALPGLSAWGARPPAGFGDPTCTVLGFSGRSALLRLQRNGAAGGVYASVLLQRVTLSGLAGRSFREMAAAFGLPVPQEVRPEAGLALPLWIFADAYKK